MYIENQCNKHTKLKLNTAKRNRRYINNLVLFYLRFIGHFMVDDPKETNYKPSSSGRTYISESCYRNIPEGKFNISGAYLRGCWSCKYLFYNATDSEFDSQNTEEPNFLF